MSERKRRSRFDDSDRYSKRSHDSSSDYKRTRFGEPVTSRVPSIPITGTMVNPGTLSLNKDGKIVDAFGREVKTPDAPVSTLRVNQQSHLESRARATKVQTSKNPYLAHLTMDGDVAEEDKLDTIDPEIRTNDRRNRGSSALQFKEPGSYVKLADALRAKEARIAVQQKVQHQYRLLHKKKANVEGEHAGGDSNMDKGKLVEGILLPPAPVEVEPDMEWWDVAFLPKSKRQDALQGGGSASRYDLLDLRNKASTKKGFFELVEHPVPVYNGSLQQKSKPIKMYHTKKELKRMRRKTRKEQRDEQQLRVLAGVEKAPEPKVRIKNMMRVLSEQAVADPSKIEQEVLRQVQQRAQNHDMRNLARMLTPEERRAKKKAKLEADAKGPPTVAVFRVTNLSNPADLAAKRKFRIDATAQSLLLTGGIFLMDGEVTCPGGHREGCNLVVAEGGKKAIKKFVKVMLRNINWEKTKIEDSDSSESEDDDGEKPKPGKCHLTWYGVANRRAFQRFHFEEFPDSIAVRDYATKKSVPHYWDLCTRFDEAKHDSSVEKLLLG